MQRLLNTTWPQADAGTLPHRTVYGLVVGTDISTRIEVDHPGGCSDDVHSAFFPDPNAETDGTFYFTENPPLAVIVHEVGHAAIDTFIRHGLPIPDGDDDMADAEEAFVHFVGMLSELLVGQVQHRAARHR